MTAPRLPFLTTGETTTTVPTTTETTTAVPETTTEETTTEETTTEATTEVTAPTLPPVTTTVMTPHSLPPIATTVVTAPTLPPATTTEIPMTAPPLPSTTTEATLTAPPLPSTTTEAILTAPPLPSTTTTVLTAPPLPSTTTTTVLTAPPLPSTTTTVMTAPTLPPTIMTTMLTAPSLTPSTTAATTATSATVSADPLTLTSGVTIPTNLSTGSGVTLSGIISSAKSVISKVIIGVYATDGTGLRLTGTSVAPNTKTYDLHNADAALHFETLPAGSYVYMVYASNAANDLLVLDKQRFTVGGTAPAQTDKLTLSSGTVVPASIVQGTPVIVRGTVTSYVSPIRSVTVGIYDAAGTRLTGASAAPFAMYYDIHALDALVTFNTLLPGSYTYRVYASNSGNTMALLTEQRFTVTAPSTSGMTYLNDILVVNKTYSLPSSYAPGGLLPEVDQAFQRMASAAKGQGYSIWVCSGYRSYDYQANLYNRYCATYGKASADTFSARPGHSEHQTGMAIDVNYASDRFLGTPEAAWLAANCVRYGFIIRYPEGKQHITGFKYEPWHIRYLGVEKAAAVYETGLTLEEYLGIDSVYR